MITDNIVLISDSRVLEVPVGGSDEPLVDLRSYSELLFHDQPEDFSCHCFKLRKSVAVRLLTASRLLPTGYFLTISEAYRPLIVQQKYFSTYSNKLRERHPEWSEERIYREASKFVCPPDIIPPHSTGGTVDLALASQDGTLLDMGTPVDADPETSRNACYTHAPDISSEGRANRRVLIEAMTGAGFVNYPTEWWHWSYGDRYWAYQTGNRSAIFGTVKE